MGKQASRLDIKMGGKCVILDQSGQLSKLEVLYEWLS